MSIYKPKPKGHSLVPVRFPAVWGESSALERVLEGSRMSLARMQTGKRGTFEESYHSVLVTLLRVPQRLLGLCISFSADKPSVLTLNMLQRRTQGHNKI